MKLFSHPTSALVIVVAIILCLTGPALATQAHGEPEGLYAHQLAHFFFLFSMGVLIYWLRERKLVQTAGWRYIQYAAFFFILWNLDAFTVHLLDEQLKIINVQRVNLWNIKIAANNHSNALLWFYYAIKLDHLLCVPALLFLYRGLRLLLNDSDAQPPGRVRT